MKKIYVWLHGRRKLIYGPWGGAEVTRLGATDLGAKVTGRAQKKILRGRYLGARTHGAEFDATDLGVELERALTARATRRCCGCCSLCCSLLLLLLLVANGAHSVWQNRLI